MVQNYQNIYFLFLKKKKTFAKIGQNLTGFTKISTHESLLIFKKLEV
jgi:hypothetical protein